MSHQKHKKSIVFLVSQEVMGSFRGSTILGL